MTLPAHKTTHGFTLLELLIAMVVFAIGMLGLAGMQGTALKDNNDAYMRSQAVFFAYDMGDRIRANPAFWDTIIIQPPGGGATLTANRVIVEAFGTYPFCSTDDQPGVGAGANPTVFCTPTQLAQYDWYRVRQDIIDALPNGALAITREIGTDVIRVVVSWNMTNTTVNNIAPSFTYDVRP
jgi:type IV pilus assembly protein PilV